MGKYKRKTIRKITVYMVPALNNKVKFKAFPSQFRGSKMHKLGFFRFKMIKYQSCL